MKTILFIVTLASTIILVACNKSNFGSNRIFVRVANNTADNFANFKLNGTDFGNINAGVTSLYYPCNKVWPIAFANEILINYRPIYYVDIVPTPYLTKGKYLLQILPDTLPYQYKASLIKE